MATLQHFAPLLLKSLLPPREQIVYVPHSHTAQHIARLSLLCSSAWLTGYEDPMIEKINQRIEDLTGLEMDTAEELQVKSWLGEPCGQSVRLLLLF